MPRGGLRSTSWKATWKHGATKTIRVLLALADKILALAKALDEGKARVPDSLVRGNREEKVLLDADELAIAQDALTTAIVMKRAAIRTEFKKRRLADNFQIAQWRREIEVLERVVSIGLEPR